MATRSLTASIFLVGFAACILATQDGFGKALVQDLPMLQLLWLRFAVHAAITVFVLKAAGQTDLLKSNYIGLNAARTLAILATGLLLFAAMKSLSLAVTTVILFLNPVIVCLFSAVFLREAIGPRRLIAILAGFAGVVVVINPSITTLDVTLLLPLVAACTAAIYVMMTRQLSATSETLPTLVVTPVAITVLLAPIQLFIWQPLSGTEIFLVTLMALCGTIGHTSLQFGLKGGSAALLSPFLYLQVVFAAGLSVVFFGDVLGANLIGGTALIVGSGLAIWYFQNQEALTRNEDAGQTR